TASGLAVVFRGSLLASLSAAGASVVPARATTAARASRGKGLMAEGSLRGRMQGVATLITARPFTPGLASRPWTRPPSGLEVVRDAGVGPRCPAGFVRPPLRAG